MFSEDTAKRMPVDDSAAIERCVGVEYGGRTCRGHDYLEWTYPGFRNTEHLYENRPAIFVEAVPLPMSW
jgi:hypothetical protein